MAEWIIEEPARCENCRWSEEDIFIKDDECVVDPCVSCMNQDNGVPTNWEPKEYETERPKSAEEVAMTPEAAIKILNSQIHIDCTFDLAVQELYARVVACEALAKQIAKEPELEADGYDDDGNLIYDTGYCPDCRHVFEVCYETPDYCPDCGKHLKWPDWVK